MKGNDLFWAWYCRQTSAHSSAGSDKHYHFICKFVSVILATLISPWSLELFHLAKSSPLPHPEPCRSCVRKSRAFSLHATGWRRCRQRHQEPYSWSPRKSATEVIVQAQSLVTFKDLALCPILRRARKTHSPTGIQVSELCLRHEARF